MSLLQSGLFRDPQPDDHCVCGDPVAGTFGMCFEHQEMVLERFWDGWRHRPLKISEGECLDAD